MEWVFLIFMHLYAMVPVLVIVGLAYYVRQQLQVGRDVAGTGA